MLPCFTRSMDRKKNNEDFSSYFHLEETGDSEADFDPIMSWEINRVDDDGEDNDDALSCSYDGSGTRDAAELINGHESCIDEDEDDDEKKEDEEDVNYGTSYCDCEDDEMHEHNQKSFVSFDSGQESVDEMEKNRMFWEACLAS